MSHKYESELEESIRPDRTSIPGFIFVVVGIGVTVVSFFSPQLYLFILVGVIIAIYGIGKMLVKSKKTDSKHKVKQTKNSENPYLKMIMEDSRKSKSSFQSNQHKNQTQSYTHQTHSLSNQQTHHNTLNNNTINHNRANQHQHYKPIQTNTTNTSKISNTGSPRFCFNCGRPLIPGSNFCSYCGVRVK